MKSITEKALREITNLEKVTVSPNTKYSTLNAASKKADVDIQIDNSDEQNIDESDIFSTFNQSMGVKSIRVDVQIDEDIEEEGDSIAEGGEDTVYGQGTNPKPEDETYLNLLKKTTPTPKVKIKVDR